MRHPGGRRPRHATLWTLFFRFSPKRVFQVFRGVRTPTRRAPRPNSRASMVSMVFSHRRRKRWEPHRSQARQVGRGARVRDYVYITERNGFFTIRYIRKSIMLRSGAAWQVRCSASHNYGKVRQIGRNYSRSQNRAALKRIVIVRTANAPRNAEGSPNVVSEQRKGRAHY